MLGFAEKAECWSISWKNLGDDNMAVPPVKTLRGSVPPFPCACAYVLPKILNTKFLAILSSIITAWQCQKKTETRVFPGKRQLMLLLSQDMWLCTKHFPNMDAHILFIETNPISTHVHQPNWELPDGHNTLPDNLDEVAWVIALQRRQVFSLQRAFKLRSASAVEAGKTRSKRTSFSTSLYSPRSSDAMSFRTLTASLRTNQRTLLCNRWRISGTGKP
jgi:hypothetical protein